jgi:hypothetical protein
MTIPHKVSDDNVAYTYYEPKASNKGSIKGVMYEKIDKNTGGTKFKSGSNALEELFLKAKGYTTLKESSAKKFLTTMFPKAGTHLDSTLASVKNSSICKSTTVIRADHFHSTFQTMNDFHVENIFVNHLRKDIYD